MALCVRYAGCCLTTPYICIRTSDEVVVELKNLSPT